MKRTILTVGAILFALPAIFAVPDVAVAEGVCPGNFELVQVLSHEADKNQNLQICVLTVVTGDSRKLSVELDDR